jgi:hypothetical protein
VLYGKYDLLDELTTYRVRSTSASLPGKFETGTCSFEGYVGVLGALEYLRVGWELWSLILKVHFLIGTGGE